nr:hypothetical protein [Pseudomonas sp. HS-2]
MICLLYRSRCVYETDSCTTCGSSGETPEAKRHNDHQLSKFLSLIHLEMCIRVSVCNDPDVWPRIDPWRDCTCGSRDMPCLLYTSRCV